MSTANRIPRGLFHMDNRAVCLASTIESFVCLASGQCWTLLWIWTLTSHITWPWRPWPWPTPVVVYPISTRSSNLSLPSPPSPPSTMFSPYSVYSTCPVLKSTASCLAYWPLYLLSLRYCHCWHLGEHGNVLKSKRNMVLRPRLRIV